MSLAISRLPDSIIFKFAAMSITTEQLEELKEFFKSHSIPKEMVLFGAITYHDVPRFVSDNLAMLKSGELIGSSATVRFNGLLSLKTAIEEKSAGGLT